MTKKKERAPRREDRAFHIETEETADRLIATRLERGYLTDEDEYLILAFVNEQNAANNICISRRNKLVSVLTN